MNGATEEPFTKAEFYVKKEGYSHRKDAISTSIPAKHHQFQAQATECRFCNSEKHDAFSMTLLRPLKCLFVCIATNISFEKKI